jgi:Zn-dependent metalloprotease
MLSSNDFFLTFARFRIPITAVALAGCAACGGPGSSATSGSPSADSPGEHAIAFAIADPAFEHVAAAPDGWPSAFSTTPAGRVARAELLAKHGAALGLGSHDALVEARVESHTTAGGASRSATGTTIHYAHTFDGVPVLGSWLVLHEDHGAVVEGNGHLVRGLRVEVTPRIPAPAARETALEAVRQRATDASAVAVAGDPTLALIPTTARGEAAGFRLAWLHGITTTPGDASYATAVDARTGDVLLAEENVAGFLPTNVTLEGETYYDGAQAFVGSKDGGASKPYRLLAGQVPPSLPAMEVQCASLWGLVSDVFESSGPPPGGDLVTFSAWGSDCAGADASKIAIEAAWAAQYTAAYWWKTYAWDSSRFSSGSTPGLWLVVDKKQAGSEVSSKGDIHLGFVDGRPSASLDAVAHEMGHLMVLSTLHIAPSQLGDRAAFPEFASLDEGIADVLALAVKNAKRSASGLPPVWTFGEDVRAAGYRDAQNPKRLQQPDTYRGRFWASGMRADPHVDATVLTHWYYLLSMGGAGTIDERTGSSRAYAVAPIDSTSVQGSIDLASRVAQSALAQIDFGADFHDFYRATLRATSTAALGLTDVQVQSIKQAWYAVGVGDRVDSRLPFDGQADVDPWPVDLSWASDSQDAGAWQVEIAETPEELSAESGPSFQTATASAENASFQSAGKLYGDWSRFVLDPNKTYSWRVRSMPDASAGTPGTSKPGPWSDVTRFSTSSKAAQLATDETQDRPPWDSSFAWRPVSGATRYAVEMWPAAQGPDTGLRRYEMSPGGPLPPPTTVWIPLESWQSYEWRVWSYGPDGVGGAAPSDVSEIASISTGAVPAADATSDGSDAWNFQLRVTPPKETEHTAVDFDGKTQNLKNRLSGDALLRVHSSSLDIGNGTFAFDLTPVGPIPYKPLTFHWTQTAGSTDPVDPELGPTTHHELPVDWSKTTPTMENPNLEYCHYGDPFTVYWSSPAEANAATSYVLTITPKSGGAPRVLQGSEIMTVPPPGASGALFVQDVCTDPKGYDVSVQAFKDGSSLDPGAPAISSYGPIAGPPTPVSPGIPVGPGTPPGVNPSQPVTFTWSSPFAPQGYLLSVHHGAAYAVRDQPVPGTSFTLRLDADTTWTWTVSAVTPAGPAASREYTFTTGGLVAPTPLSPTPGDELEPSKPVTFTWSDVFTRGGVYRITVSDPERHIALVTDQDVRGTSVTLLLPLAPRHLYDWKIASLGWGGDIAASEATFKTTAPSPPPSPLEGVTGITCGCTYAFVNPDCYVAWDDGTPADANEWEIQLTGTLPPGYTGATSFAAAPGDPGFRRSNGSAEYDFNLPAGNANVTIEVQARDTRTNAASPWVDCQP